MTMFRTGADCLFGQRQEFRTIRVGERCAQDLQPRVRTVRLISERQTRLIGIAAHANWSPVESEDARRLSRKRLAGPPTQRNIAAPCRASPPVDGVPGVIG